MKKRTRVLSAGVLIVFTYVMFSYTTEPKNDYQNDINEFEGIEIPDDVMAVIDNKCYGCHNTESKSTKSKGKLNFDKFKKGYSKSKTISKLGKIVKDIHENEMPPEKFLAKYPDKKLTPEESELLTSWAKGQRTTLAGE